MEPTTDLDQVDNPLCRRFLKECDGQKTIEAVAQQLHIPQDVVRKITSRCIERGWGEIEPSEIFQPVWQVLLQNLGLRRALQVIGQAAESTQRRPEHAEDLLWEESLFAIEVQLTSDERQLLMPIFDQLFPAS